MGGYGREPPARPWRRRCGARAWRSAPSSAGRTSPIPWRRKRLGEESCSGSPRTAPGTLQMRRILVHKADGSHVPGSQGESMTTATRFLRRDPADVQPWAETCGQIRCLIEEKDGAAGEVHLVQIQDA